MPQHVRVVPPDPAWAEGYRRERALLMPVFGPLLVELHHIAARRWRDCGPSPSWDLMPVVTSLEAVDRLGPGAGGPGLPVHGGVRHPGQAVFPQGRGPSDPPAPRLSGGRPGRISYGIWRCGDYLRACPAEREAYGALKRWLAGQYPEDIEGYCDGKDAFVRALERRALDWYDEKRP